MTLARHPHGANVSRPDAVLAFTKIAVGRLC